eukprot:gene2641-1639_t
MGFAVGRGLSFGCTFWRFAFGIYFFGYLWCFGCLGCLLLGLHVYSGMIEGLGVVNVLGFAGFTRGGLVYVHLKALMFSDFYSGLVIAGLHLEVGFVGLQLARVMGLGGFGFSVDCMFEIPMGTCIVGCGFVDARYLGLRLYLVRADAVLDLRKGCMDTLLDVALCWCVVIGCFRLLGWCMWLDTLFRALVHVRAAFDLNFILSCGELGLLQGLVSGLEVFHILVDLQIWFIRVAFLGIVDGQGLIISDVNGYIKVLGRYLLLLQKLWLVVYGLCCSRDCGLDPLLRWLIEHYRLVGFKAVFITLIMQDLSIGCAGIVFGVGRVSVLLGYLFIVNWMCVGLRLGSWFAAGYGMLLCCILGLLEGLQVVHELFLHVYVVCVDVRKLRDIILHCVLCFRSMVSLLRACDGLFVDFIEDWSYAVLLASLMGCDASVVVIVVRSWVWWPLGYGNSGILCFLVVVITGFGFSCFMMVMLVSYMDLIWIGNDYVSGLCYFVLGWMAICMVSTGIDGGMFSFGDGWVLNELFCMCYLGVGVLGGVLVVCIDYVNLRIHECVLNSRPEHDLSFTYRFIWMLMVIVSLVVIVVAGVFSFCIEGGLECSDMVIGFGGRFVNSSVDSVCEMQLWVMIGVLGVLSICLALMRVLLILLWVDGFICGMQVLHSLVFAGADSGGYLWLYVFTCLCMYETSVSRIGYYDLFVVGEFDVGRLYTGYEPIFIVCFAAILRVRLRYCENRFVVDRFVNCLVIFVGMYVGLLLDCYFLCFNYYSVASFVNDWFTLLLIDVIDFGCRAKTFIYLRCVGCFGMLLVLSCYCIICMCFRGRAVERCAVLLVIAYALLFYVYFWEFALIALIYFRYGMRFLLQYLVCSVYFFDLLCGDVCGVTFLIRQRVTRVFLKVLFCIRCCVIVQLFVGYMGTMFQIYSFFTTLFPSILVVHTESCVVFARLANGIAMLVIMVAGWAFVVLIARMSIVEDFNLNLGVLLIEPFYRWMSLTPCDFSFVVSVLGVFVTCKVTLISLDCMYSIMVCFVAVCSVLALRYVDYMFVKNFSFIGTFVGGAEDRYFCCLGLLQFRGLLTTMGNHNDGCDVYRVLVYRLWVCFATTFWIGACGFCRYVSMMMFTSSIVICMHRFDAGIGIRCYCGNRWDALKDFTCGGQGSAWRFQHGIGNRFGALISVSLGVFALCGVKIIILAYGIVRDKTTGFSVDLVMLWKCCVSISFGFDLYCCVVFAFYKFIGVFIAYYFCKPIVWLFVSLLSFPPYVNLVIGKLVSLGGMLSWFIILVDLFKFHLLHGCALCFVMSD